MISFVRGPFRPAKRASISGLGATGHHAITIAAALFDDNRTQPSLRILRIVKSGGKELALALEEKGYDWLTDGAPTAEVGS